MPGARAQTTHRRSCDGGPPCLRVSAAGVVRLLGGDGGIPLRLGGLLLFPVRVVGPHVLHDVRQSAEACNNNPTLTESQEEERASYYLFQRRDASFPPHHHEYNLLLYNRFLTSFLCVSIPLCPQLPVWVQHSHRHLPNHATWFGKCTPILHVSHTHILHCECQLSKIPVNTQILYRHEHQWSNFFILHTSMYTFACLPLSLRGCTPLVYILTLCCLVSCWSRERATSCGSLIVLF